jgi:hypothetical protein
MQSRITLYILISNFIDQHRKIKKFQNWVLGRFTHCYLNRSTTPTPSSSYANNNYARLLPDPFPSTAIVTNSAALSLVLHHTQWRTTFSWAEMEEEQSRACHMTHLWCKWRPTQHFTTHCSPVHNEFSHDRCSVFLIDRRLSAHGSHFVTPYSYHHPSRIASRDSWASFPRFVTVNRQ